LAHRDLIQFSIDYDKKFKLALNQPCVSITTVRLDTPEQRIYFWADSEQRRLSSAAQ